MFLEIQVRINFLMDFLCYFTYPTQKIEENTTLFFMIIFLRKMIHVNETLFNIIVFFDYISDT